MSCPLVTVAPGLTLTTWQCVYYVTFPANPFADNLTLLASRMRTNLGEKDFLTTGFRLWNNLPMGLKHTANSGSRCRRFYFSSRTTSQSESSLEKMF